MPTPHLPKPPTSRTPVRQTTPAERAAFHTDGKHRTITTRSHRDGNGNLMTVDIQASQTAGETHFTLVVIVPASATLSGKSMTYEVPANTHGLPPESFTTAVMNKAAELAAAGKSFTSPHPDATPHEVERAMDAAIDTPLHINGVIPGSKEDQATWKEPTLNVHSHHFTSGVLATYRINDHSEGTITIHNIPMADNPNLTRSVQIVSSGLLHNSFGGGTFYSDMRDAVFRTDIDTTVRAAVRLIMAGHELPPSTINDSTETVFRRIIEEANKLPPLPPSQHDLYDTHLDTGTRLAAITPVSVEVQHDLPNVKPASVRRV